MKRLAAGLLVAGSLMVGLPRSSMSEIPHFTFDLNPMRLDFGGRPRSDPPSIGAWEFYAVQLTGVGVEVVELKPGIALGTFQYPLTDTIENLNNRAIALANQRWVVKAYVNITTTGEPFATTPPDSGYPKYIIMYVIPKPPVNPRVG